MTSLFKDIDIALDEIEDGWTSSKQGHQIAESIIKTQSDLSVEIGVFAGKGIVCMGLAHAYMKKGRVIGIDPWSAEASAEGQVAVHKNWWKTLDHEAIYQKCVANIKKYGLENIVSLIRKKSDDVDPPSDINFIRIDGNHNGSQAMRDVKRFCTNVAVGGILHLDDVDWPNGARKYGSDDWLQKNGWEEIDRIDTGAVYQKI